MTFKEELEAQGKRLVEAQRRYFASQAKPDGGRDEPPRGELRPGLALLKGVKFYGGGEVPGGAGEPKYRSHPEIARFVQENFYGSGEVPNGPASQDASGQAEPPASSDGPGEETPPSDDVKGFTFHLVIATGADAPSCPRPPLDAEFILHLLLRHDEHDALIGDLIERYGRKCARLGARRANLWFYAEVLWTALPLLKRALIKASGLVAFGEWVRRHVL